MRRKRKVILYDYFRLLTKKLKLNTDQIKKPLKVHCNSFQYINIYTTTILFQLQKKLQYPDIGGKIKIYDNTNRDFRVIGLLI